MRDFFLRDISTLRHLICATSHLRDIYSSSSGPRLVSLNYVRSGFVRLGYIRYSINYVRLDLLRLG